MLQEISWSGSSVRAYRDGGRGYENVLTAEALTALDFLPRAAFLGGVVSAAVGADEARGVLASQVEEASVTLLPDDLLLGSKNTPHDDRVVVQPDGILTSPQCYVLIEARRIRRSSFQPEQLAREYAAVLQHSGERSPLLLLLLGSPPPVAVKGLGRLSLIDAVDAGLPAVLNRMGQDSPPLRSQLLNRLPEVVAWITWDDLCNVLEDRLASFDSPDPSVQACVTRLVQSALSAVARHG